MGFRAIRDRLRYDFRLALLTAITGLALLVFIPFATYRLIRSEWIIATVDISIIIALSITIIYAWKTGDSNRPSHFLMYFIGITGILGAGALGQLVLFWVYPMLVANFLLVNRTQALGAGIFYVAGLLIDGRAFPTPPIGITFTVTSSLICFYSYIFAYRTEMQRLQLENLASRDALTGLFNRRTFQGELLRAHEAFIRDETICGLLIIDIDYFKNVNDTWGHEAGDEVLIRLARLIEGSVRQTDRFFRFGGEEFVLLVSPTQSESLKVMANHLCEEVRRELIFRGKPITVSIGGAILRTDESPESWFARADVALYFAKNNGRDRMAIDF